MARKSKKKTASKKKDVMLGPDTRVLILCGPEQMLKRQHFAQLRAAINESAGAEVDPATFDGRHVEPAVVFDELRTLSLLQPYRLVVVDDADQFVKAHRPLVERYAEHPADDATLVLRSGNWNSPKLDKLVAKVGAKIKCDAVSAADAVKWLTQRAKGEYDRKLDKRAAQMLVDRLGVNLSRLDNELAKLAVMVGEGEAIEPIMIEQVVGRSSDEQAWAVQEAVLEALASTDGLHATPGGAAIEKVHELIDLAGQPDVLVLYFVADLTRKLHHAAMMLRQGAGAGLIARELRLWGPRRDAFFDVLRRLKSTATADLLARIVRLDARSKSGFGDPTRNLECFCAVMADEMT